MTEKPEQVNPDVEQTNALNDEELNEVVGGTTYMDGSSTEPDNGAVF